MNKNFSSLFFITSLSLLMTLTLSNGVAFSQEEKVNNKTADKLELETLKIQGNKELPKVLFVVPWQNAIQNKASKNENRLVLHSLYGDLYDPITPINVQTKAK